MELNQTIKSLPIVGKVLTLLLFLIILSSLIISLF